MFQRQHALPLTTWEDSTAGTSALPQRQQLSSAITHTHATLSSPALSIKPLACFPAAPRTLSQPSLNSGLLAASRSCQKQSATGTCTCLHFPHHSCRTVHTGLRPSSVHRLPHSPTPLPLRQPSHCAHSTHRSTARIASVQVLPRQLLCCALHTPATWPPSTSCAPYRRTTERYTSRLAKPQAVRVGPAGCNAPGHPTRTTGGRVSVTPSNETYKKRHTGKGTKVAAAQPHNTPRFHPIDQHVSCINLQNFIGRQKSSTRRSMSDTTRPHTLLTPGVPC